VIKITSNPLHIEGYETRALFADSGKLLWGQRLTDTEAENSRWQVLLIAVLDVIRTPTSRA
jgi:hypothetical protein